MQIVKIKQHTICHYNGGLHAEKHPALMHTDYQEWALNGVYHREDGPARLFRVTPDGRRLVAEWWSNGKFTFADTLTPELFEKYWHQAEVEPHFVME